MKLGKRKTSSHIRTLARQHSGQTPAHVRETTRRRALRLSEPICLSRINNHTSEQVAVFDRSVLLVM